MREINVTNLQIAALGEKIDGMADAFSPEEQDVLMAVFHLAGIAAGPPEVEGFLLPYIEQDNVANLTNGFALGRKSGGKQNDYYKVTLTDLLVTSY